MSISEFNATETIPSLSVCVSLKNRSRILHEGRELELFPNCVRSLLRSVQCGLSFAVELVVADFQSDDWPLELWLEEALCGSLPARVLTPADSFSKGQGLNIATHAARGEVLFLCDADMLVVPELLEHGVELVRARQALFPLYRYLDSDGSPLGLELYSFGNAFVSWEMFLQAGGIPEFNSWGGEDDIFHDRIRKLVRVRREYHEGFFHQWHPDRCRHENYANPSKTDFLDFRKANSRGYEGWRAAAQLSASHEHGSDIEQQLPYLTCLCATYLRPHLLANLIHCFQCFDYPADRCGLIVLDDAGQYPAGLGGENWRILSVDQRFATLGEKRNALAKLAPACTEAFVILDDDDAYLPWTLKAHAWALSRGELSCPERVFIEAAGGKLIMVPAEGRFHSSWAFSRELFARCGGYPAKNLGEDFELLSSMRRFSTGSYSANDLWPPWLIYRWARTDSYHVSASDKPVVPHATDQRLSQSIADFQPHPLEDWLALACDYLGNPALRTSRDFVAAWREQRMQFELKMIRNRSQLVSVRQDLIRGTL